MSLFPMQTRLNIPDLPVGGFAMAGGAAPAAAPAEEEEAARPMSVGSLGKSSVQY